MPYVVQIVITREVKGNFMLTEKQQLDFSLNYRCLPSNNSSYLPFYFHLTQFYITHYLLTGGLPRAGRRLSGSPTSAGPCGVANNKISPVLVGADPGWSPSLLGLVMITIWWSSLRLILPEFRRVSKSAKRSSDVCPVIRVSDIAMSHSSGLLDFEGVVGGSDIKINCCCCLPTPI